LRISPKKTTCQNRFRRAGENLCQRWKPQAAAIRNIFLEVFNRVAHIHFRVISTVLSETQRHYLELNDEVRAKNRQDST
jgi:hypothetical protein